ncbi:MAG: metallophosphoesterase family protein [Clostridiales bacterium]|nr:metallophosphoesterase family protein [Clostridiales bacterium]
MNILTLSDTESPYLWNMHQPIHLRHVDLILSCGDLDPDYLSFIATYNHAPVLYVHGNHDDRYSTHPPEGCFCIEDQIYCHLGVRILGLGGSIRYRQGENQYTETEMCRRIQRLWFSLRCNKGFDILLTHAPAFGVGDGADLPHRGFQCFHHLLKQYEPAYMVHGHTHLNCAPLMPRKHQLYNTCVVNAYEQFLLTL